MTAIRQPKEPPLSQQQDFKEPMIRVRTPSDWQNVTHALEAILNFLLTQFESHF